MRGTEVCTTCGHANPPESRYCGQCGALLVAEAPCPACGATNPADQGFCNRCGNVLSAEQASERPPPAADATAPATPGPNAAAAEEAVPADAAEAGAPAAIAAEAAAALPVTPEHLAAKIRAGRSSLEGERKQVTVLFCDVVGSMELAESTDPETWRRTMQGFFTTLCEGIHRFEGTVDKFTGDGVMALFGAPIAHEDHAQRACYAALHLRDRLAAYATELRRADGLNISMRMGLNSGEVVVGAIGDDLGMDYTAVGHTVGLAQRMESLAEPGKAYVTAHTASLVEGYLALADLGEFQVKGASEPLRVFELVGTGSARGRLDVSRARGLSRFIGREEEMRVLEEALERAQSGEAAVIGIVGEAGVGKSRLCHEFAERCRGRGLNVYHVAAQAHTRSVPLRPVLELMRGYFDISEQDSDQSARERIAGKLLLLDEGFAEDLPLVFDFLAVPDPRRPAPRMDPEARQRLLLSLVRRLVRAQSDREPGMTLFEDLHWIDQASEAFLDNYVNAVSGTRNLTVVNFRPEYRAGWMSKSYYRQIALAPLGPEEAGQMLDALLGDDPSLAGPGEMIRERTGGNPFFIEELVRSLVEDGTLEGRPGAYTQVRLVEDAAVPASVQAVLAARIDRLAERDKAVLQAAAVIGKEFSEPVLERVADREPAELEDSLRALVAGEFVYEQELYPETLYAFKHPLTQEVAYRSQLADRRAAIHAAVATATAEQYPDRLDERAALLAEHWAAAGERLEAARWHARAAAWTGTQEPTQTVEHWQRVRELADELPSSDETTALALTSRIYNLQFGWRLGIGHDEAEAIFTEAERIAARTGDIHSRAILLSVYGAIRGVGDGEIRECAELTRRALALAEESEDPSLYLTVVLAAYAFFVTGDLDENVTVLERAIELSGGDPAVGAGVAIGCPLAYCMGMRGTTLSMLGRVTEGQGEIERAAKVARDAGDLETIGWTHGWAAYVAGFAGDLDSQLAHAQQGLEIAERIGDSFSRVWAWEWVGFAHSERGELERAIECLEHSRTLSLERRAAVESEPWRLPSLGQAYIGQGDAKRGVALIREGLELARGRGQRPAEAWASAKLAGALLAGSPDSAALEEAGTVLARGLELVEEMKAKLIEPMLRIGLASLAGHRGDQETRRRELHEAHRLYAEVGAAPRAEAIAGELATAAG